MSTRINHRVINDTMGLITDHEKIDANEKTDMGLSTVCQLTKTTLH